MLNVVMLSVKFNLFAECHYAESCNANSRNAECHVLVNVMLNVFTLNVNLLDVMF
jgi:hypothetical protein